MIIELQNPDRVKFATRVSAQKDGLVRLAINGYASTVKREELINAISLLFSKRDGVNIILLEK